MMMNHYREHSDIKPEIYLIKLKEGLDDKTFNFLLSLTEEKRREQVLRLKVKKKAEHKLLSEFLVKYAIKKSFGIDAKNQHIAYTEYGKPYLTNYPDIHFNISHSGNCVVCAVFSGAVGVDAQKVSEYKENLAKKVCSQNELKQIETSGDKALEFTKLWTKKEAYLKFLGTGIQRLDLKNVSDNIESNIWQMVYDGYVITTVY